MKISFEVSKNKISELIEKTQPLSNVFYKKKEQYNSFYNEYTAFVFWASKFPKVNINNLKSKTELFSKLLGTKPLSSKILGSENLKNNIWIVNVDDRQYVFFLSLNGLNIETTETSPNQVLMDLKELKKYFKMQ